MTNENEEKLVQEDNVDLCAERFLGKTITNSMLGLAFRNILHFPLCLYEAATHAAGSAIASVSVLIMLDRLKYLRDSFNMRTREMGRERIFSPSTLKAHTAIVSGLKRFMKYVVFGQSEVGNILNRAFCTLPTGTEILRQAIARIGDDLVSLFNKLRIELRAIDTEIDGLPAKKQSLARSDPQRWKHRIQPLLLANVVDLLQLLDKLDTLIREVEDMKQDINNDWTLDTDELRDNVPCRPRRERRVLRDPL